MSDVPCIGCGYFEDPFLTSHGLSQHRDQPIHLDLTGNELCSRDQDIGSTSDTLPDDWLSLHTLVGYTIMAPLLFSLAWSFIARYHAYFSYLVRPPGNIPAYLKDIIAFRT